MKKITFLLSMLVFSLGSSYGQGFYFSVGAGFAFPLTGPLMDGGGVPYNGTIASSTGLQTYNMKGASFSSGLLGKAAFGYMINENVGVELAAQMTLAPKKYTSGIDTIYVGNVPSSVSFTQQSKGLLLFIPSLVMQTSGDNLKLYSRVGLVIPARTKIVQDQIFTNLPGTGALTTDDVTYNIKNSFSLGFAAAIGVKYKLSEKTQLWAEVSFLSLNVLTKQGTLVAFSEDGQSYAPSSTGLPTTINYSKTASVDSSQVSQAAYAIPFSSIGLHVGVSYSLGSHSRSRNDMNKKRKKF